MNKYFTHARLFSLLCFFSTFVNISVSQDRLFGLTTNGGPGGKGNAFNLLTTGGDFKVMKAFTSLGANPKGDLIKGVDGNMYGMTQLGGKYGHGSIFKMTAAGVVTIIRNFNGPDGIRPQGGLVQAYDNNFYGMTYLGGTKNFGTIFRITAAGVFTVLHNFDGVNGKHPTGNLIVGLDANLYGMTSAANSGQGVLFKLSLPGLVFENKFPFYDEGPPRGSLVALADGSFSGLAARRNPDGSTQGTIFTIKFTAAGAQVSENFTNNATQGSEPFGSLIKAPDGFYYGLMRIGGTYGSGTIFRFNHNATINKYQVIAHLNNATTGGFPEGSLCPGNDGFLYGTTTLGGTYGNGTIFKVSLAGVITVLRHLKAATDGGKSSGSLFKNSDGNFYGMANQGGIVSASFPSGAGTIFKINSTGSAFTVLSQLPDATLGIVPRESLSLGRDGNYYGTTEEGGTYGVGTIFKLSATGVFTKLRSLNPSTNGANPKDGPIHASDGNLYGTTSKGGAYGHGTIYKITTAGVISTLHSFNGNLGSNPHGKLMQASDGYLYGVTRNGGANNQGTIFRINLTGTYSVLRHLLASTDGGQPEGNLYQASPGGTIWGTATIGGVNGAGTIFKLTGTVFSVVKHMSTALGRIPSGNLFLASNGVYYGTTNAGGTYGYGTIFRVTGSTGYTYVVHHFQGGASGGRPYGGLVEDGNKILYGTASVGGTYGGGVLFKFALNTVTYGVIKHLEPGLTGTVPKGNLILKKSTTTSSASLIDPTSLANINQARMLYPNPARDHVILQSDQLQSEFTIHVINMSGQVVRSFANPRLLNKTSTQVDINAFPPGLYMLLLQSQNKKELYKFIKQ